MVVATSQFAVVEITKNSVNGDEEIVIIICPKCYREGLKVRRTRDDKNYYQCSNCKTHTGKPIKLDKDNARIKLVCYFCKSENLVRNGISTNDKIVHFCNSCKKHSVKAIAVKEILEEVKNVICGECKKDKLTKKGFNRFRKQMYRCFTCERRTVRILINTILGFVDPNKHLQL
jgi:transposase-like protein